MRGGLASLLQDLDRHDLLPRELGQGIASELPGNKDPDVSLEQPWRAGRWMFSTTAARNPLRLVTIRVH